MGIEQNVKLLSTVRIGFRKFELVLLPCAALTAYPIDLRVEALRSLLMKRSVVLIDCDFEALLTEDIHDRRAEVRQHIVTALAETRRQHMEAIGEEVAGPWNSEQAAAVEALVDSIEECVALHPAESQKLGDYLLPANVRFVILGKDIYDLALEGGVLNASFHRAIWRSRPWKEHLMAVSELPDKHRTENEDWPATDYSRHCESGEMRDALANALGMGNTLKAVRYRRTLGLAIGQAVALEQSNGWLATDLKREHFLLRDDEKVWHVDHADDVFLLREATFDEMARCIGPLYQQFDFIEWQGFREGYFDELGLRALNVLDFFDGNPIYDILLEYSNRKSRQLRRSGEFQRALDCFSIADEIVERMNYRSSKERERLLCQNALVQGDIHLEREALEEAMAVYTRTVERLHSLEAKGLQVGFELCGGLVNLGVTSIMRENMADAKRFFEQAQERAEDLLEAGDDRADYVIGTIRQNLSLLK